MKMLMTQSKTGLTPSQVRAFWMQFASTCGTLGIHGNDEKEVYRKSVMREECGKDSMKLLNRTTDFEKIMVRLAEDAGDYVNAVRFAVGGDEKRTAWLIEQCARQIMEINKATHNAPDWGDALDYVMNILHNSGIMPKATGAGDWWMDVPATLARKVLAMLDTHRRRLLRKAETGVGLVFNPKLSYQRKNGFLCVEVFETCIPSHFAVKII
jgi:hypothetical protein